MSTSTALTPDVSRPDEFTALAAEGAPGAVPWWHRETEAERQRRFEAEALPHLRALYATAYRLTSNAHDAEDLVQETYSRAYRAFDSFTPGTQVRAWLFTILRRARTDALRRAGRRPVTLDIDDCVVGVPAQQERLANGGESIARAVAALPDVFRAAVVLRDVQELSYDEIARALGVPIGTVMSRIHRGRALLRQSLGELRP